jgi:hypothetical protein
MKREEDMTDEEFSAAVEEFDRGPGVEIDALRAFAQAVMADWPDCMMLDGGDLQELAERHGLLTPETRHEPCGEGCSCNEYAGPDEWADGVVCYRKTPLLTGSNAMCTPNGASTEL